MGASHARREDFTELQCLHVTMHRAWGLPSLRSPGAVACLEGVFAAGCERSGFSLAVYSLQGTHCHLVVEADDTSSLGL